MGSSKLRKADCNALVERITAKIKSWTCKFLSYAGRAQLVRSVLFAIQVYRSSLLILPKGVTKKIEQVMRSFLWKGDDLSKGGAKVAWDSLCLPYKEGGLGFRDVEAWNRAAMVKHIWHLCTDSDHSIWSSWVRNYLIKNRNFWTLRAPGECSWTWRKLLKLRLIVHDEFSLSGSRVTRKRTPKGLFSTKSAWDLFRHKEPPVPWHRAVWFPAMHFFFGWLCWEDFPLRMSLVSMGIMWGRLAFYAGRKRSLLIIYSFPVLFPPPYGLLLYNAGNVISCPL